MKRCPICHARLNNEPIEDTLCCNRCGADLRILWVIQKQATLWLKQGLHHLFAGNQQQALYCLQQSAGLHQQPVIGYLFKFLQD